MYAFQLERSAVVLDPWGRDLGPHRERATAAPSGQSTFRFQGRRFYFTIGKVSEAQARAKATEVDGTLALIERGRLQLPPEVNLEDFVAAGGKVPVISARPEIVTLRQLFDHYLSTHANGTLEENSLGTVKGHLHQFTLTLGERFRLQGLTLLDCRHMSIAAARRASRRSP